MVARTEPFLARLRRRPARPRREPERAPLVGSPAPPIDGRSPSGAPAGVAVGQAGASHLALFMTSGCLACREVWAALGDGRGEELAGHPEVVVVTPDPTLEDARAVAALTPAGLEVVMSTEAWQTYRAGPSPWVALVRDGTVVAEGPAGGWHDVRSLALPPAPA